MDKIKVMAREEFWKFAEDAKSRGRDLAEVLDRGGYLLTPSRLWKIKADTYEELAEILSDATVSNLTYGRTQNDVLDGVIRVLRASAKDMREMK